MYCIQFLLPVLLLPRPLHPNQLFEHSLFLGKSNSRMSLVAPPQDQPKTTF